jgi:hypothetical protein
MALSQINFFVEFFAILIFFQTHVHLGTLTFEKNYNHKNFLEKFDLRQRHYLFINPKFHFKFFGFSWVRVLPSELMYLLFVVMAVLALFIAIGFLYRASAILFLLCFTYVFLIDSALYLNHYYMVILFSFLLCFLPANQYFSLDSEYLNPKIKTKVIPA